MIVVLLLAALVPPIVMMYLVYQQDKIEKEPMGLVVAIFFSGVLAAIPIAFIEIVLEGPLSLIPGGITYLLVENFIGVALVEEGMKYLVFKMAVWKQPDFNYRFDAIVYAVTVSLGFAAIENVFYVFGYGLSAALFRAFLSIPGHAMFGIFMGIYLGTAKQYEQKGELGKAAKYKRMALLVAVLLHGFYDFILSIELGVATVIFFLFIIAMDIITIRIIKKQSAEDVEFEGGYSVGVNPITDSALTQEEEAAMQKSGNTNCNLNRNEL